MWVLGLPRTPKTEVVGHSSLSERRGSTNGHGTAQNSHPRMVGPVRDITNPLRLQSSRGYATTTRECDYVGVSEAAVALARAECHTTFLIASAISETARL